jgi:N6-adenosine-specific RNA methylase IME4
MQKAISKVQHDLPVTIELLHRYILIGKEKLKAHKAKIRAIEKVNESYAAKEAALQDAQDIGDALLEAESKLGEILAVIKPNIESSGRGTIEKKKSLPNGITKKESHRAQTLAANPEIVEEVKVKARQEKTIPTADEVYRQVKNQEQKKQSQQKMQVELPKGKYRTIVIDPPWPMEKIEREVRPNQTESLDYPTMTMDEIKKFPIQSLIDSEVGSHIYLWCPDRFVRTGEATDVMQAWGIPLFKAFLIWHKNVGFTPFGTGFQIRHEFILWGTIGNLPLLKIGESTVFEGKVREHSRKPDEFYDLVRRVSPMPRIDIFSREKRNGFEQWGNEQNKF